MKIVTDRDRESAGRGQSCSDTLTLLYSFLSSKQTKRKSINISLQDLVLVLCSFFLYSHDWDCFRCSFPSAQQRRKLKYKDRGFEGRLLVTGMKADDATTKWRKQRPSSSCPSDDTTCTRIKRATTLPKAIERQPSLTCRLWVSHAALIQR